MAMEKVKLTDSSVIELIRSNMPVATRDKNGLYGKSYVSKVFTTSSANTKLIKLFSFQKNGFSGKMSVLFRRAETGAISEFSVYANAYQTIEKLSDIEVYRRAGSHGNIAFYRDEEYVYVYMPSNYYYLYCKLDFFFIGELILEEQSGLEVSTLTKIPLIE